MWLDDHVFEVNGDHRRLSKVLYPGFDQIMELLVIPQDDGRFLNQYLIGLPVEINPFSLIEFS